MKKRALLLSALITCAAHIQAHATDFRWTLPEQQPPATVHNTMMRTAPLLPVNKYFGLSDYERQRQKRKSIAHIAMGAVFIGAAALFAESGKRNEDDSFIDTSTPMYIFAAGSAATGTYFLTKGVIVNIMLNRRR